MLHDLRTALHSLRRHPGATLVSLGVLALGIGAATALFSLYHALVLKPLAIPDPGRLVKVEAQHPGQEPRGLCLQDVKDLERNPGLLADPFCFGSRWVKVQAGGQGRTVYATYVSEGFFPALRPRFVAGAPFAPGATEGAVLGQDLFEACFGRGARLAGQTVSVSGFSLPVVGVVDRAFQGLEPGYPQALWLPHSLAERIDRVAFTANQQHYTDGSNTTAYARLRPGATQAQAEASLAGVAAAWSRDLSATHAGVQLRVNPTGREARWLWEHFLPQRGLLMAALALLGLLGTLNVVQLQVARWMATRRDLALRQALGADRWTLLKALGLELGLLVLLAGALALPTGLLMARGLEQLQPPSEYPLTLDLMPGATVLAFAALLLLLLALLMGGMALVWLARDRSAESLHGGTGQLGGRARGRRALLALQLALAVGLLGTTLPVFQGLRAARAVDLGFQPKGLYAVSFAPPWFLNRGDAFRDLWNRLLDRLRPQGEVTGCMWAPLEAARLQGPVREDQGLGLTALRNFVQPDFLKVMGVPLLAGRPLGLEDDLEGPSTVVVDQSLAQALWPGESAVGRSLYLGQDVAPRQVVGVCASFRLQDPLRPPQPFYLLSQRRSRNVMNTLLVRSDLPEPRLRAWLEREAEVVEPRLALLRAEPLTDRLDRHLQPLRLASSLLGALSLLALILAAAGTYGLQSLLAAQRTREFGLRAALGSSRSGLVLEALRTTLQPALVGAAGGLALAWALRRLLTGTLGSLGAVHLSGLLLAALLLLLTALAAALIPALRASRVAPAEALRAE